MNFQELSDLVQGGETDGAEFKKTTGQRSEGMRTVCAMLNGGGGFVLFGVTAAGKMSGQNVTSHTLEEVHNELRRIEPAAFPDVETVPVGDGNSVIAMRVPSGGGPYTYDDRAYMRNGPTTIIMPQAVYERKLLERSHATNRWENQIAEGLTVDDLCLPMELVRLQTSWLNCLPTPPSERYRTTFDYCCNSISLISVANGAGRDGCSKEHYPDVHRRL